MCIDFDGHHSGGSSFVYVYDNVNTTTMVVLFCNFVYDILIML